MKHPQDLGNLERKKINYSFELELVEIMLKIPHGCRVFVEWGRKNIKLKSICQVKNAFQNADDLFKISNEQKMVWQQKVNLIFDQRLNSDRKSFEERQNFIRIILEKNGAQKLGGSLVFNIVDVIQGNYSQGSQSFQCRLEKSPDFGSYLKFVVHYRVVEERNGFNSSTGGFRCKSPSSISRSPEMKRQPQFYQNQRHYNQSPRNVNSFISEKAFQIPQCSKQQIKEAEQKINQLLTAITGLKNELHIKNKQIEMLRGDDRLKTEEIQCINIEMNQKVMGLLTQINQIQGEYKRTIQENNRLNVEIQRLKMQLIRSLRVKQTLENQISQLNTKYDLLHSKYKDETDSIKRQNERFKFELFQSQSRIFKLQQQYQNHQNRISQITQQNSSKLSHLEYQNILLNRKIEELEQQLTQYEQKSQELETALKQKSVEKGLLEEKLAKTSKNLAKEQELYKNAYNMLRDNFEEVSRDLTLKKQILEDIEFEHMTEIKQKDEEIELLRKKFNSFLSK